MYTDERVQVEIRSNVYPWRTKAVECERKFRSSAFQQRRLHSAVPKMEAITTERTGKTNFSFIVQRELVVL